MGSVPEETEKVETEIAESQVESSSEPQETEVVESSTSTEEPKNETARETTARVLRELSSGKAEESKEKDSGTAKVVKQAEQNPDDIVDPAQVAKELEIDPDLIPPARLDSREQQVFNNLPKTLKRAFSRSIKNLEAMTTNEKRDLAKATQESRSIIDAVQPFAAEWGSQGFTVPSAIAALAANQQKLMNPETRIKTFIEIGQSLGIDIDQLPALAKGEAVATPPDISAHPQFRALHESVTSLQSEREQAQIQAAAAPIAEEMRAVQHEIDPATGGYRYPELHDEAYLESLKPLVSTLVSTVPGIGYGEALRRAHYSRQGFGASNQTPQARSQVATTQKSNNINTAPPQRAVSAAVTVRGGVASATGSTKVGEPPPEALRDARATTRWALEQLRNGVN